MRTARVRLLAVVCILSVACAPATWDEGDGEPGETPDPGGGDPDPGGTPETPGTPTPGPEDQDGDGYRAADGDCDDFEANINPMAIEVAGNTRDDDCDGATDEAAEGCDCGGGADLPGSIELCDSRFLLSWEESYLAPRGSGAGAVVAHYGSAGNGLGVRAGCSYAVLATGYVGTEHCGGAIEWTDCMESSRQPGLDLYETWESYCGEDIVEPDPSPEGGDGAPICDTHQLVLRLRAPSNASGLSFDFIYMSTEYPEWRGEGFNDTFYAVIDRPAAGERRNISFDDSGAEIEVDNAFFEDPPTTDLAGTGYDGRCFGEYGGQDPCGSSTGWLRTSWTVTPNEELTLTFSIHDEGDGIYDSLVILDNFQFHEYPAVGTTDPLN